MNYPSCFSIYLMAPAWFSQIYEFGTQGVPEGERYRLRVGNLLAAMGVAISLGYCFFYLLVLDSVSAFVVNLVCTLGYFSYFAIVRAGHPKLARLAVSLVFLIQILLLVLLFLSRHSGVQLYFIITAPIAFILFEARDRTLRLALAAISLVFYFIAELVHSLALVGELEPSLYRAIVLANIAVVSLVILLIQAAFLDEIDRRELALQHLARTDQLTGLLNRRAMLEWSEAQVSQSARHAQPLTVLMIDIDHFKPINDEHGHVAGDRTLVEVANAMRQITRLGDQLGRFGGEEFVALLPQTDSVAARSVAEKLRERIAALSVMLPAGVAIRCTVSLGLASLRPGESTIDPVLSRADMAMYQAKAQGRNRCILYDDRVGPEGTKPEP